MSDANEPAYLAWRYGLRRGTDDWRNETGWRPDNLRKPGLSPSTVIDVGVARGTPNLYDAFPEAHLVLIEPISEFEEDLERICRRRGGEYVLAAVGAEPGRAVIHVDPQMLYESSLLVGPWRASDEPQALERREVEVTTLDALLVQRGWKPPFGLKIDAEGFEDRVIEGAGTLLGETQFVIAEVSILRQFEGGISFAGFIALMDARGFALCDLLDGQRWSSRGVDYVDALFRPK